MGLSINNIITNEDITITYTPSVINYSYVIIKNNVYGNPVVVNDGSISEILNPSARIQNIVKKYNNGEQI